MAKRTQQVAPPRLPALDLDELTPIGPDEVRPGRYLDYARLSGASLVDNDLAEIVVQESEWHDVDLSGVSLPDARFADTRLVDVTAASLDAPQAEFRNCEITGSRLGSLDLRNADLRCVRFDQCKLGFLALQRARLADVTFERCVIEDLDLTDATVERVAFAGSQAGALTVATRSARDLDLRGLELTTLRGTGSLNGLVIGEAQLGQFARVFAQQLGIRIA
jgi:uncharacterized protein YjbI with pentapeptide repeats